MLALHARTIPLDIRHQDNDNNDDDVMNTHNPVSITALRTLPIFATLHEVGLASVAASARMRHIERRTAVINIGDRIDSVYLILSGQLKVQLNNTNGRDVILHMLEQGELFGELEAIDDQPSAATVSAVDACELIVISQEVFVRCMAENPDVSRYVMGRLVKRLRLAGSKICSLAQQDVHGRVESLLHDMAENHQGQRVIARPISRSDIARMVGASREMVSRVMRDLQLQGAISESEGCIRLHMDMADTA